MLRNLVQNLFFIVLFFGSGFGWIQSKSDARKAYAAPVKAGETEKQEFTTEPEDAGNGAVAAEAEEEPPSGQVKTDGDFAAIPEASLDNIQDSRWKALFQAPILEPAGKVIKQKIFLSEKRDDLEKILRRHRFHKKDVKTFFEKLPEDYSVGPQTPYLVTFFSRSDATDIRIIEPNGSRAVLFQKRGKDLNVGVAAITLTKTVETYKGRITSDILVDLTRMTRDEKVSQRMRTAFLFQFPAGHLSRSGAKFEAVVEKFWYRGEFVKFGDVLQASLEVNGVLETRYYVKLGRGGGYIDLKPTVDKRNLYSPVDHLRVTSLFDPRRMHPRKRRFRPHQGVDFALPKGEPVYSVAPGKILTIGQGRAPGKYIKIKHQDGKITFYDHLSAFEPQLKIGQEVQGGQMIGKVGCTGYCTSPHLHLGLQIGGLFVDPLSYIASYPYQHKDRVAKVADELKGRLTNVELRMPAENPNPVESEPLSLRKTEKTD